MSQQPPFQPEQSGQGYPQYPQETNQQGYPQYPQDTTQQDPSQGFQRSQQGMPPQGFPQQGYPQGFQQPQQGMPPQGFPQQGYPQGFQQPQQGYPRDMPPQGYRQDGPPQRYSQFPQQPYQQPPMMQPPNAPKKRHTGLIIVGIVVALLVFGCVGAAFAFRSVASNIKSVSTGGSNTGSTTSSIPTANPTQVSTGTSTTGTGTSTGTNKIGDTVKVGNDWDVTIDGVKTSQGGDYLTPTAGNTYLVFTITMKNLTSQTQAISSIVQYTLTDASGTKYNITIDPDAGTVIDGSADANAVAKGVIVYEVPTSVKSFTLKFESNSFETSSPSAEWSIHL